MYRSSKRCFSLLQNSVQSILELLFNYTYLNIKKHTESVIKIIYWVLSNFNHIIIDPFF